MCHKTPVKHEKEIEFGPPTQQNYLKYHGYYEVLDHKINKTGFLFL